jgi:glutaredoxin 3
MSAVTMYTTDWCPYCRRAEALLSARGVSHIEHINVDRLADGRREMMNRTGRRTVPQIFIGERHVGGFDDLAAADRRGDLALWLRECANMVAADA